MGRICAWCERPLGLAVAASAEGSAIPTSHGICGGCARALLAGTERARWSARAFPAPTLPGRGATAPGNEEE